MRGTQWLAALLVSFMSAAHGAEDATGPKRCAAVVEDASRLACYDALFRPSVGASASKAVSATMSPADFGLSATQQRRNEGTQEIERVEATVASVRELPTRKLAITLDNGQSWVQTDATSVRLRKGDRVTIRKGALGSFLLIPPDGSGGVRVKRRQ